MTHGRSLDECRKNLRNSLLLMVETHRDEARVPLDASCIQEAVEIDTSELHLPPNLVGVTWSRGCRHLPAGRSRTGVPSTPMICCTPVNFGTGICACTSLALFRQIRLAVAARVAASGRQRVVIALQPCNTDRATAAESRCRCGSMITLCCREPIHLHCVPTDFRVDLPSFLLHRVELLLQCSPACCLTRASSAFNSSQLLGRDPGRAPAIHSLLSPPCFCRIASCSAKSSTPCRTTGAALFASGTTLSASATLSRISFATGADIIA